MMTIVGRAREEQVFTCESANMPWQAISDGRERRQAGEQHVGRR